MNVHKYLLAGAFALAVLPHGVSAAGQEEAFSPVWQKIEPAWSRVSQQIVAFVGEGKQKMLADLAYAAVAGELCEGLELDAKTFQSEFDRHFGAANSQAKSPADLTQYGGKVAMYFGVYVGLLTAVGLQEGDRFCGAAQEMLAKGEGRFWTTTPTKIPSQNTPD